MSIRPSSVAAGVALLASLAASTQAAIIVNEFDYDSIGDDLTTTTEFVELYNPDSAAQSLAGYTIVFFNGAVATNPSYLTVPLTGSIPGGGYYTLGNRTGNTLQITDTIQNGSPDSFGIYTGTAPTNATSLNLVSGTGITYEGSNAATPSDFTLVGATFSDGDVNDVSASFQRIPNGTGDFVLSYYPTPMAVNSLVPEPTTLAIVAIVGTLTRRRR